MKNNAISNENSDDDTADGNENDLIVIEESTKFFSASSAWARYSDGLEHNFLPPDKADPRQDIEFGDGSIGTYLSFFFNFTNGEDETQTEWHGLLTLKHKTHFFIQLPPKGWESDYDWQWKISQSWATPSIKWEWLELGWKASGFATLPLGDWDVLYCNSMEFYIGTLNTHRLTLKNVTVGAYLQIGFISDDLRVYSPCGQKSCHIINNQIYCRGFGRPEPLVGISLIGVVCLVSRIIYKLLLKPLYRKITCRRVAVVDREIIEMARLREEAWESNRREEVVETLE